MTRPGVRESDMAAVMPHDLLGRPLRDLRLSVIDACNFRCPYCMPADRIAEDHGTDSASRLSFDEIEILVRGFARLGMRKLRLTGGEPLLRKRLPELVARLAAIDGIEDLALTTNGRSEEHTSELQSLMRISSAVFCLKKKKTKI